MKIENNYSSLHTKTRVAPYQQMNEGVVKVFTTRQYSRATSRSSPIGPSTGCSFINKTRTFENWKFKIENWKLLLPTSYHQNKYEEMSSGHFDSEAQRERRTERFRLLSFPYPLQCPVDISTVRPSESAEQNTFDFLSTYPNKTRMKKKSAFWTNWNKKMYRQSGTFKLVSESGWRVFDTLPPSHCHHCCVSSTRIIIAVY